MRKPASSTPVRRSRIPVLAVILGLAIAPTAPRRRRRRPPAR